MALAPSLECEIANLDLMPAAVNRRKGKKVMSLQVILARALREAGRLPQEEYLATVRAR